MLHACCPGVRCSKALHDVVAIQHIERSMLSRVWGLVRWVLTLEGGV